MTFRRLALVTSIFLVSFGVVTPGSYGATTATAVPGPGLPLYQFVNSGTGPLPWNAYSLESAINDTTMVGGPHGASNSNEGVIAYRTATSDIALYQRTITGTSRWRDLSPGINAPAPGADPIPFFDPSGAIDVLYVDAVGDLIVLSANDPVSPRWSHTHHGAAWRSVVGTNLSLLTGVTVANGLPSIQVTGQNALIAVRNPTHGVAVISLTWSLNQPIPYLSGPALIVSAATNAGAAVSDPVLLAGATPSFVTTSAKGDLELFSASGAPSTTSTTTLPPTTTTTTPGVGQWLEQDLTTETEGPKVTGPLATASSLSTVYVSALSANGNVELFSAPLATYATATTPGVTTTLNPNPWSVINVTSAATGSPPLSGSLFLAAGVAQVTIAGSAANWGDLFALTSVTGATPWSSTDVSVTAGSAARTVGARVTGIVVGSTLSLVAAGISSPPRQGVGVYAIPSSKWSQAVNDGWPILSETGGLGTMSAPWVGYTGAASVATSPDFLLGQSIYNSHKRVTWLSFWTASGPLPGETLTNSTYFSHGFAAGAWVAAQIDQYRSLGVGLKPDWVIFDPEGYPDNHSGLHAPGSSPPTVATYTGYWSAMLQGWVRGVASVDPTLNAAVYASQSEYRNYSLATQSLPVFVALAFGGGGPTPIAGASGSNVRGYIAFSAVCSPASTLRIEESTLKNPPWSGQFNTLQFNAGVYCPPV